MQTCKLWRTKQQISRSVKRECLKYNNPLPCENGAGNYLIIFEVGVIYAEGRNGAEISPKTREVIIKIDFAVPLYYKKSA